MFILGKAWAICMAKTIATEDSYTAERKFNTTEGKCGEGIP